ncbi:MAG: hypothetical protein C3F13_04125 [Anaerolineales bacterium]|nr:hypothetical protein [Anaerolineae bacterium]PWB55473.1 MAG: hypothetical protein C3F13_04125 [Anaerolineales bacterium]
MTNTILQDRWDEGTSQKFLDYGRYFVPKREAQVRILVALLKDLPKPKRILELCCGEGLLAEQILDKLPGASYWSLDGNMAAFEFFQQHGWNTSFFLEPDEMDHPNHLYDQLRWFEEANLWMSMYTS